MADETPKNRGYGPSYDRLFGKPATKCMGCQKPAVTLYCNECVSLPPVPDENLRGVQRHNGIPISSLNLPKE